MTKLAVLCSGRGTDLQSIIDAIQRGELQAEISIVITDKPNVKALERAEVAGIKNICVDRNLFATRADFEAELLKNLAEIDLVVLAGFMRILSPEFVKKFQWRMMNIHPSLLPSFPGAHAHKDALAHGVKISGCTVHFVDEGTDSGPIILQAAVEVKDDDTEETLSARILEQEHIIYPQAIQLFVEGRLKIEGRHVKILEVKYMTESKDPRRLIGMLMESLEFQEYVAENLTKELKQFDTTEELLPLMKSYSEKLKEQRDFIEKISHTAEAGLYKKTETE